ncbi:MAG TPA: MarR family winged helix-turn-helix transcriptional regulator [Thermoleophilaceae bacterium]|jgi:DNA-binding MarR family transcriptional regulator
MRFEQPPPEPLAGAIGFLLSWNGKRLASAFADNLEPLGLRPPHFGVMNLIDAHPGSAQQQLVDLSMIDPSSMVRLIDELEEMGVAERRVDSADRRRREVHLSAAGKRKLERARRVAGDSVQEVLEPLDEEEQETLRRLLRKLAGLDK